MNLENIISSERNQTQKATCSVYVNIQNEEPIGMEHRSVISRGREEGRWGATA